MEHPVRDEEVPLPPGHRSRNAAQGELRDQ